MKNLNKYFKLCAERKAVEAALEASIPQSDTNIWLSLTAAFDESKVTLAAMRRDMNSIASIVDIDTDGLFVFKHGCDIAPPTAEMVDELNEWIEDRS